eukprot:scaffold80544_cov36-Prasinocladus_malaysianus.AAC.1
MSFELNLLHKTNYWGSSAITSRVADDENDVEEACVWVMARPQGCGGCCNSRGRRVVSFEPEAFEGQGGGDDGCEWVLYKVRGLSIRGVTISYV